MVFLQTRVPFGALQSCSEQLTVEIRPCVKVGYPFVSFVCIRALSASPVMCRVIGSVSASCKHGGRSKMGLINATSCLGPDVISNHRG